MIDQKELMQVEQDCVEAFNRVVLITADDRAAFYKFCLVKVVEKLNAETIQREEGWELKDKELEPFILSEAARIYMLICGIDQERILH